MTFPPFPFLICTQAQKVNGSAVTQRGMKNKVSQVLLARHPSDDGPSVLMSDLEGPRLF
jgi:hypothetical protein